MDCSVNDLRCSKCNKLLFRYSLQGGLRIEIKCPRCGTLTVFQTTRR